MMAYMGTVIVILLNILVAQMSTTYSQAKKVARLEYDVDRILQLTRMERFPFLVSKHKYLHSSENWGIILPIAELFLLHFFLGRICAWSITKKETGSVKWNSHKVWKERFDCSHLLYNMLQS